MIQSSSITPEFALEAIRNVLNNRDAFGTADIPSRIPFPAAVRRNQVRAAIILSRMTEQLGPAYNPQHLTWLATKLLAHLAKDRQGDDLVAVAYPTSIIATALRDKPTLLGSKVGFASLLASEAAKHRSVLSDAANKPMTPRRLIWADAPFSLMEATHPRHLREDGLALRHCTGSRYDHDVLRSLDRTPTPRESLFALFYWQQIAKGEARFFTLMEGDAPRVTLRYSCASANMTNMQALNPLTITDRLLPPLCRALHHLRETDYLVGIRQLPYPDTPNVCLMTDGSYGVPSADNMHYILAGYVPVPTHVTPSELQFLCSVPHLRLGLEDVPVRLLKRIERIAGTIVFGRKAVRLDRLTHVGGHVSAPYVPVVTTPNLVSIGGSNFCDHTQTIEQPRLVFIGGSNFCDYATLIHQPALRHIGRLNVLSPYAEICQPNLPPTPSQPVPPKFLASTQEPS